MGASDVNARGSSTFMWSNAAKAPRCAPRRGQRFCTLRSCAELLKAIINNLKMYVCLCKGVSDRTVLATIRAGACSVAEVGRRCGAGSDCGACRGTIRDMIEEHEESESAFANAPALATSSAA